MDWIQRTVSRREAGVVGGVVFLLVLVILMLALPTGRPMPTAVADIVRGDTSNYFVFTSPVPLDTVVFWTYFTNLTTPDFKDTLTFIAGTNYSYRKRRQFTQTGNVKFQILYTDTVGTGSADNVHYIQWSNDQVYPDSTAYMGAASGLTVQSIWHYADNTDTGRTVNGFGGWGNRKLTITVKDGAAVPIQGVECKAYVGTANKGGSKLTNGSGVVVFYLATSTVYELRFSAMNYSFTTPLAFTTNANLTDTTLAVTATLFNPGTPPNARLVHVYGTFYDIAGGTPAGVIVMAELVGARKVWFKTAAITPYVRRDTTDASGQWDLYLLPNDSLTPTTNQYKFTEVDTAGVVADYTLKIPADSAGKSWQFTPVPR